MSNPMPPPGQQPPMMPPPQGPPQGPPVMMPPPGQPGQLPPPPPPGYSAMQPQPKRRGRFPRWLITIIAIVVVGGGVYAFNYFTSDVAQAKVGDCAHVSGTKSKPDYKAVACDSADANYIVAKSLSSTSSSCGGTYDEYIESGGRGPSTKLCLMPNWAEGNCYNLNDEANMGYPKIDCKPGTIKIVKIIKGSANESACPEGAGGFTFPEPPTTICAAQQ
jgi:hypothetical protein